ncbi:hypothetical protein RHSIM_Rhsim01G0149500 [Rhododendron simsii]|uniref:Ycf20 n=1 Tax=Rhododendron simsii TaxID=118357 RepID=A0A834HQD4_RHOSS|nr:hypothetical protein RHSIM_Rhsim01G0149500 [Rhododendron simsii]
MKVLFFLVGFYCATAFATVIGQTGDWDILAAALSVAVVEGIGALTYRTSSYLFSKVKSSITMFNYWKAGLSLGLFLDSFKYKMENAIGLSNPFNFEIDVSACHYKTNPVFAGHFASSRTISAPEAVNMDIAHLKLEEDSFTDLPQNIKGGSKCGTTGGPINMKSKKRQKLNCALSSMQTEAKLWFLLV